jgi:hypothetical protein
MAITNAQIEAIDKERKDAIWDGDNLGAIKPDSLKVKVNGVYTDVRIDQLAGIAKSWLEGWDIMVEVTFMDTSVDFLKSKLMKNQVSSMVSTGGNPFIGFGNSKIELLSTAGELLLHEYGITSTTRTKDWIFWKAEPKFSSTEFGYGGNTVKEVVVSFTIFPDLSKSTGYQYGGYGDYAAYTDNAVPKGVWVAMSKQAQVPGVHLSAFTLKDGQKEDLECFAGYAAATYTVTAAINDGTDINATDTSVVYDGLAGGTIAAGDYVLCGTEIMYITAATSTTLTVNRGVWGSTAAIHLDNAVLNILDDVAVIKATDVATWASSSTADVTVGTTFQGTGTTKIGRAAWVSTGSSNITATVNTKASPNSVATAA